MREASLGLLTGYLGPIVDAIVGSVGRCPSAMRLTFKQLRQRVEERFPQAEHEVGQAVSLGDTVAGEGQWLVQGHRERQGRSGTEPGLPTLRCCVSWQKWGQCSGRIWGPGVMIVVMMRMIIVTAANTTYIGTSLVA